MPLFGLFSKDTPVENIKFSKKFSDLMSYISTTLGINRAEVIRKGVAFFGYALKFFYVKFKLF